jgi:DNA-binding CsgD family transcriptional regulator
LTVTFPPVAAPDEEVFVGRQAELAQLAGVTDRARRGQPWLASIEGESGVGKTALARHAVASAGSATRLWARADPAESDLDYGILEQLVRGVDQSLLRRYPLLTGEAPAPAPFAVGAQFLGLLGALQRAGLVLVVVDDLQWTDHRSAEALSFAFRRLSVDAVAAIVTIRGDRYELAAPVSRTLLSVQQQRRIVLSGLSEADVTPLAAALGAGALDPADIRQLYDRTGGHTLYLQTILSDAHGVARLGRNPSAVPASLAATIADQLASLPAPTRALLELLAVVNAAVPLALLGAAAEVAEPADGIQPALRAGLVDLAADQPGRPAAIRHTLQRDAVYERLTAERRRALHARAVGLVDTTSAWAHRVAALNGPDEHLAAELEKLAVEDADGGHLALAATRLQWAADISPDRANRERRLLTAALHLSLGDEARSPALRAAVQAATASPLRSCVLGTMAFAAGQPLEAEQLFSGALDEVRDDPDSQPLAATLGNRLAGTFTVLGDGAKVMSFGQQALATGCLDAAAASQTRTLVAIGASTVAGARAAVAELGHLDPDPARVGPLDIDGLAFRGIFRLLSGELAEAVLDMAASVRLARRGATFTLGLRGYSYLALAQYLAGAWDDALLTSEQGFSAAAIHARQYEMPLLHLAASCAPASRGGAEGERHAKLAEDIAASLGYAQERVYAAMARALVCQAAEDYAGMASALGPWQSADALDNRSRLYAVLWRPLLAEGLIGAGDLTGATAVLDQLRTDNGQVSYLQPALAWLEGWLAEERGRPDEAERAYAAGEAADHLGCPVYTARLQLAHGRLLRRQGNRKAATERLRHAGTIYRDLRAAPFITRTDDELAACGLRREHAQGRPDLAMTDRETEVARLIERGMTNAEIATELFITPKAVEYHLGNIYAKFGLKGRQQLRRMLGESRR